MIEISEDLITGVEHVDNQHRKIISRVNSLIDACTHRNSEAKDEAKKTLEFLADYISVHFRDEEKLMAECMYPEYITHQNEHISFAKDFLQLVAEFRKTGAVGNKLIHSLNVSVVGWLVNHIGNSDVRMAKYYIRWKSIQMQTPRTPKIIGGGL